MIKLVNRLPENCEPDHDWILLAAENPRLVTYQLSIDSTQAKIITVGHLGQFEFPAGRYLYTGSARSNLIPRVKRHLSKDKKLRWHIDYLLAENGADVMAVNLSEQTECECNREADGIIVAPGFGASDCKAKCGSHLKYFGKEQ